MTSGRVWGARLAALLAAAIIIPACSTGSSGNVGISKQALWNSQAGVGAQPTGTPSFWHDPTDPQYAGVGGAPPPQDLQDIRTYTRPDIYILGLKHPLMVDLTTQKNPIIIFQETRVFDLINQFRYSTYFQALGGPPLPFNTNLIDHPSLRQNARAHSKHYAVWHPTGPLPATNAEGDDVLGRMAKSKLAGTNITQIQTSGNAYASADSLAAFWITTYGGTIPNPGLFLNGTLTTLVVGFWQQGGGTENYYWTGIVADSVNAIVATPTLPVFGGPGF
jgi:hypothetical protein